jgi:hypothetical protein
METCNEHCPGCGRCTGACDYCQCGRCKRCGQYWGQYVLYYPLYPALSVYPYQPYWYPGVIITYGALTSGLMYPVMGQQYQSFAIGAQDQ